MAVTQADVARLAGVSRKTVSNVINDYPFISRDVQERVEKAIAELGYRPNYAARSLRSGRTRTIGLVVPELDVSYFPELARRVIDAAETRGLTVMVLQSRGDVGKELAAIAGESTEFVEGIILSPVGPHVPIDGLLQPLPVVLVGDGRVDSEADHFGIDNVAAGRAATLHLLSTGATRIAYLGHSPDLPMAADRHAGFVQALAEAGLAPDPRLVIETTGYHHADGAAAMEYLLASLRPEAVFCATDLLALGALRAAHDHGLRVPGDLTIIGVDDIEEGRYSIPTLSTVAPDKAAIAELAVARLTELIDAGAEGTHTPAPKDTVTPFSLIVRESTST